MNNKCRKNKPCKAVEQLHVHDERAGLFVSSSVNMDTYERGRKIGYRFPRHQGPELKGFTWLNFCPWCGVDQVFKKRRSKK